MSTPDDEIRARLELGIADKLMEIAEKVGGMGADINAIKTDIEKLHSVPARLTILEAARKQNADIRNTIMGAFITSMFAAIGSAAYSIYEYITRK